MTEINKLIGNNFVTREKFNKSKETSDSAYEALKNEYNTFKNEKLTDAEKKEAEYQQLLADNKKYKEKTSRQSAIAIFAKAGIEEKDYTDMLDGIVSEDEEKTISIATAISNAMSSQKQLVQAQIEKQISKQTPKPEAGAEGNGETGKENYEALYADAVKKGDYVKMATYTRLMQEQNSKK